MAGTERRWAAASSRRSELSSIDHVDLWAGRRDSGVPLRVEVYADGDGEPAFTSQFRDFSARPARRRRGRLHAAGRAPTSSFDDVLDIADAANQYAPVRPPGTVAGLAKAAGLGPARSASTAAGRPR